MKYYVFKGVRLVEATKEYHKEWMQQNANSCLLRHEDRKFYSTFSPSGVGENIDGVNVYARFTGIDESGSLVNPLVYELRVLGGKEDGLCKKYATEGEAITDFNIVAYRVMDEAEAHYKKISDDAKRKIRAEQDKSPGQVSQEELDWMRKRFKL